MNLLLLDDDSDFIEQYIFVSKKVDPAVDITGFSDENEFLEFICGNDSIDAILIDIELGDYNGIDIACAVYERKPLIPVIFVTGYPQKYCQGIFLSNCDLKPFAFISKPLEPIIIQQVYKKLISHLICDDRTLHLRSGHEDFFILFDDIIYLESFKYQTHIYTKDEMITVNVKLKELSKQLPDYFLFSHNSFLINCKYVTKFNSTDVTLEYGKTAPISRSRKDKFCGELLYMKGFLKC